jgi:hypothetical protein
MKVMLRAIGVALLAFGTSVTEAASAPTLNVSGGQLLGASGVNVDGSLYNVDFVEGTCVALFDGCDEQSDFAFQTGTAALAAAQALLDEVFTDSLAGSFDSIPTLTLGCGNVGGCYVATPISYLAIIDQVNAAVAFNAATESTDFIGTTGVASGFSTGTDPTFGARFVYARWTSAAVVPLPAAGWLLLSAIGGVFGLGWYRKGRPNA